ncbi:MAG: hypothetical protein GY853_00700 [PVC group bacterium]|nr:hypothetical protein [PVC group bacterium]
MSYNVRIKEGWKKHPKHCTEARTPKDKCTCECKGKCHGIQKQIGDFE